MRGITARATRLAIASAVGGALLVAAPVGADEQPHAKSVSPSGALVTDDAAPAPRAQLSVTPDRPVAGAPVRLDAGESTGAIVAYSWDLDGDGSFETATGQRPVVEHALPPGARRIAVRVEDAAGRSDEAGARVTVAEAAQPAPEPADDPDPAPNDPAAAPKAPRRFEAKPRVREAAKPSAVHVAASSGVTIQNFAFSPATINVSVGDTVTWTNQDPTAHTATGAGGSFDTGPLKKGESGSHTFQSAGSFSYICSIHPNMKGTVVVKGASSGGSGSSGSGSGSGGTSSGDASTSTASGAGTDSGALPHTGLELLAVA